MDRISNEQLVAEAIRRLRQSGGPRTPRPGTPLHKLLPALLESRLIEAKELRTTLNRMLVASTIIVTGTRKFKLDPNPPFTGEFKQGWLKRFHPDAPLKSFQCFFENGTPMPEQYMNDQGQGVNKYWVLTTRKIYLTEDGLPKYVLEMMQESPIDCY